jgi:hypothetical protein
MARGEKKRRCHCPACLSLCDRFTATPVPACRSGPRVPCQRAHATLRDHCSLRCRGARASSCGRSTPALSFSQLPPLTSARPGRQDLEQQHHKRRQVRHVADEAERVHGGRRFSRRAGFFSTGTFSNARAAPARCGETARASLSRGDGAVRRGPRVPAGRGEGRRRRPSAVCLLFVCARRSVRRLVFFFFFLVRSLASTRASTSFIFIFFISSLFFKSTAPSAPPCGSVHISHKTPHSLPNSPG